MLTFLYSDLGTPATFREMDGNGVLHKFRPKTLNFKQASETFRSFSKEQQDRAKKLIQSDCSVDQANQAGQTPLMFASLFGRNEIAKVLITAGANTEAQDFMGYSPKSLAESQGNEDFLKLISVKKTSKNP